MRDKSIAQICVIYTFQSINKALQSMAVTCVSYERQSSGPSGPTLNVESRENAWRGGPADLRTEAKAGCLFPSRLNRVALNSYGITCQKMRRNTSTRTIMKLIFL